MLLGVIADDFTGASDIANTLAKGRGHGGLRTTQFLGIPTAAVDTRCEAGVISLKTRSVAPDDAIAQSIEALHWLSRRGCRQFIFKYCSTFDSAPKGNIGPVGEALARELGVKGVVVCPAFPTMKRTIYMGHLFVGDRLLSESGLQDHPLNPMTDPDIRRWLTLQCAEPVGHVPLMTVALGATGIRYALDRSAKHGEVLTVVDAVNDDDMIEIGRACAEMPLLTGGSGIAIGLPEIFIRRHGIDGVGMTAEGVTGPEAILAGSCSPATLEQVEVHATSHPVTAVSPHEIMTGNVDVGSLLSFIQRHQGRAPLVYSSGSPDDVRAAQEKFGHQEVAAAIEQLFARLARLAVDSGLRRLVVAGGETSGAVVSALDLEALAIGPEIDPGVPVLLRRDGEPLALALKSGNFGTPDFFAKALALMEGRQ